MHALGACAVSDLESQQQPPVDTDTETGAQIATPPQLVVRSFSYVLPCMHVLYHFQNPKRLTLLMSAHTCMQGMNMTKFIEHDIPVALKLAAKLKRSHIAAAGAASACAAVLCSRCGPKQVPGGVSGGFQVLAGPGIFSESESVSKVAKGALKQLETIAFGGRSGLAAWLLARCCRVRLVLEKTCPNA